LDPQSQFVKGAIWARGLPPDELEKAARGISERVFAKGAQICRRGERLDYWTGIVEGLVKIGAVSRDGKAMTFAGAASGSWFGEGSMLKDEPRQYDAVAIRASRIALMSRATFMWLYDHSQEFNRFLVRHLNERVGQFIATIENDRILGPRARVARHLSWFFNPVLYPQVAAELAISQEELGLLAGVSRTLANRALQELAAEGIIAFERSAIRVLDHGRLRAYDDT
jgi:CRP-like cAMP-binding protein